ncbi:hypothetical protein NUH87_01110 [Pseudomonas batumici]|uniref:hypothetical protein n=1 Tax=Pseudomonas batumici TaxID=226910 RepID=UPI0030CCE0D2
MSNAAASNNGYTGTIWRGVDYSPTWPAWTVGAPNTQTTDSDFANDAFQSLWSNQYQPAPEGDQSSPSNNGGYYRDDLKTISGYGFNLIRLYNWNMNRGAGEGSLPLDHINFLNYAQSLGLSVVVPVSDYFLSDDQYAWAGASLPDYQFSSAPQFIQNDFNTFIQSITDPTTGKIHTAIQSISVGNEGDIGEGLEGASPSNFLARTIWWIVNLNQKLNGTRGTPATRLSATFSNADQGGNTGSWFNCLINGVVAKQQTPNGATASTFSSTVSGLSTADPSYTHYYYNSVNISQVSQVSPYPNTLQQTLALYDQGAATWPGAKFDVPLLLMEVFAPNRVNSGPYDQAAAAVGQFSSLETYLLDHNGGTDTSTTWLMGYNYFEFNDEQELNKLVGLYQYSATSTNVQTGTTVIPYSPYSFPSMSYPLCTLSATAGPGNKGTLIGALQALFNSIKVNLSATAPVESITLAAATKVTVKPGNATSTICQTGQGFTLSAVSASGFTTPPMTLTFELKGPSKFVATVLDANGWVYDQYFSGNQLILQYFYNPSTPTQNLMVTIPLQLNTPYFSVAATQVE